MYNTVEEIESEKKYLGGKQPKLMTSCTGGCVPYYIRENRTEVLQRLLKLKVANKQASSFAIA